MRISDWSSDVGSSYLDINQAWDENTASVWIPRLEAAGVELVEQPVARSNFDALRRLSADNGVAILADESLSSLASAFELARARQSVGSGQSVQVRVDSGGHRSLTQKNTRAQTK